MPSEIIKKGFHDKTKALVEQAMKLLASSLQKGEEIPSRTAEAYKVIGPGGWSQDYESRLDYFGFVHDHEKDIEELPEFGMWLKELREDPVISKHVGELVGSRRGMLSRTAWDYLSHLLLAQISSGRLDFDLQIFELSYLQMEEFFHKETVEFRAFSPLQNFESDSGSIDLGGGLMIRKTTNSELERLWIRSRGLLWYPIMRLSHSSMRWNSHMKPRRCLANFQRTSPRPRTKFSANLCRRCASSSRGLSDSTSYKRLPPTMPRCSGAPPSQAWTTNISGVQFILARAMKSLPSTASGGPSANSIWQRYLSSS